ncbi:MAG TPA: nucleoside triphosphate pyrophosphohydrolase family protein [Gammaproteobacteria bacterium]|nr:nucleoside triphosphate pyrophosphohydrolase family protein [Gammaproteobacteria bacterium]
MVKMTLDEYQQLAERTSRFPGTKIAERGDARGTIRSPSGITNAGERLLEAAIGATGEAGEVLERVKKAVFHHHDVDRDKLREELGDVLWYVAEAASVLGLSLDDVAQTNVAKLQARYPRGFSAAASRERK